LEDLPKENEMARGARSTGTLLLGLYLILTGINYFVGIPSAGLILALLGLVAGIFLLLGR
jgi:hypothetical protein